jgi:hypothetical protein
MFVSRFSRAPYDAAQQGRYQCGLTAAIIASGTCGCQDAGL